MEGGFHEINDELRNCDGKLFFFEEIHETFSSVFRGRRISMTCKLFLNLFCLSFPFRNVKFQKLYVMRNRCWFVALSTKIVQTKSGFNGRVNQVICFG